MEIKIDAKTKKLDKIRKEIGVVEFNRWIRDGLYAYEVSEKKYPRVISELEFYKDYMINRYCVERDKNPDGWWT